MLFAVGVIALFAFLMCFALLRKVFCIIAQSALRFCAKCKNANNAITMSFALIAVGAITFLAFCAITQNAKIM